MRTWGVCARFPEVKPAHKSEQSCNVDAPDVATAAQRALETIYDREEIRGKHITIVNLTIVAAGREKTKAQIC